MTGTAAAARELETLMPYLVPPRTPLTPEQVERAFAYVMALEAGGGANVAGREKDDPELPFLMLRLAEDLVLPVTTVPGDEDPTADSFILERVGDVLLSALRDWQRDFPATGCIGLARSLLRFITGLLADQDDRGDVAVPQLGAVITRFCPARVRDAAGFRGGWPRPSVDDVLPRAAHLR